MGTIVHKCHTSFFFNRSRKDLDKSRIKGEEKAVKDVIDVIKSMVNPFDNDHDSLVHIASGVVASSDIEDDMGHMIDKGKTAFTSFFENHIVGEKPSIYSTIKKTNLKTFSRLGKKVTSTNSKGQLVAMKNSKELFAKLLLIAKSRNLQLDDVFRYSLRPYPCSVASSEGDLVKTSKSKLVHAIEGEAQNSSVFDFPTDCNACILDAMAILQTLSTIPDTFGELTVQLLTMIVKIANNCHCKRSDFVCGRYPRQSIKNLERNRRAIDGVQKISIYSEHQKVPRQWKKFLSSGENKEQLMKFIYQSWTKADPHLFKDVEVFLSHEEMCHKFFQSNDILISREVEELCCDHEEADTRMLVHASHASQCYENIIIKSPDSDVLVIALNACLEIDAKIYFETGIGTAR